MMQYEDLWERTAKALDCGDFTLLDELLSEETASIVELLEDHGWPELETNEAFAWACFNGRTSDAETLLNRGVDPTKGDRTGMPGFHSAASRGHIETVKLLIRRNAPMEQLNMYGGTVLGQALWSAVNEPRDGQAEAIEELIRAGARIEQGTLGWWESQVLPSLETKARIADVLRRTGVE